MNKKFKQLLYVFGWTEDMITELEKARAIAGYAPLFPKKEKK